ncbi:hypothetical protein CEXT_356571 [Caerostris extrusa]|uniref:EF-hand domain-containing protein n=1 Tax=Caerostris extrusa TaxID=172846 RepID=A0AAV4XFN6_CAEEX|nr:hypothetical protein CEXT_356571 [Caerostris extrusa]
MSAVNGAFKKADSSSDGKIKMGTKTRRYAPVHFSRGNGLTSFGEILGQSSPKIVVLVSLVKFQNHTTRKLIYTDQFKIVVLKLGLHLQKGIW